MTNPDAPDMAQILRDEIQDENLRGFFRTNSGQLYFDRRYTFAAIQQGRQITARTAELNLIGLDIVPVSDEFAAELGYNGGQDGTIDPTL